MIERASEFGASAAVPLISGDTTHQSAGDMLRQAREAHGLDVAVVAAALKVPVQKIEALEADDIDALPDPVFARALAASVCRALRVDPRPVLEKLPGAPRPGLSGGQRAMSASFHTGVQRSNASAMSKAMLTIVGLLLVGAALLFWLPQSLLDRFSATVDHVLARGQAVSQQSAPSPADSAPPPTSTEPVPAGVPMGAPGGTQMAVQDSAVPAVAPPPAPVVAPPPTDLLVFTARTESWVSVTEAGGKQLLHRTVNAGEKVGVSGNLPLSVTVGRASGVDVQLRGKPFELGPVTRGGGVARFEVKQ
ncbi:helix-turn-helix domain-containing protein [Variovorax sp. J22R133]|uniref:helix-turn-helix domain-containing protein n=1 Tax=Variovorax brevis TaxID=3053503 RepID=UPI00257694CC|nr:helix-turn-helix domain-containing protein [Variovorax sp. J22R133]MDM0112171.1 helix-turn-helix domain-containing protein [Variovorax sp. J22R133]